MKLNEKDYSFDFTFVTKKKVLSVVMQRLYCSPSFCRAAPVPCYFRFQYLKRVKMTMRKLRPLANVFAKLAKSLRTSESYITSFEK